VAELSRSAATISEEAFIALVGDRSLGEEWPDRDYRCTAFDIDSAEFTVWSKDSGVPLSRAVASSCSVPGIFPPITIGDRRYMDGGLLSGTNAHLVSGADTVVIVSVMSRILPDMGVLKEGFDREVEELRAGGSTVEVIEFDDATIEVVAMDLMSSANSAAVAAIAVEQGKAEAERIGAVWG
jgi:NTE family protein